MAGDNGKPATTPEPTSQERGTLKTKVTRDIKLLRRRIAEKEKDKVESQIGALKVAFQSFESYHVIYHATLTDESTIDKDNEYFDEIETNYMNVLDEAHEYLDNVKASIQVNVQEKTLELLDNQSNLAHLTLSTFDGSDVLDYLPWITVFDETVDSKNIPKPVKLARMLQYTGGIAHRQIRHCPLDKINGYDNARKILSDMYGAPHIILHKTMESLKGGPLVVSGQDLTQLGNDLQMALNTVTDLKLLSEIDNQLVIRDILKRCPQYLLTKYCNYSTDFKFEKSKYPGFKEFVTFIQKWAIKQSDPIWSHESESYSAKSGMGSVNSLTGSAPVRQTFNSRECNLCSQNHLLFKCPQFEAMSESKRFEFIVQKRLCFICFGRGHSSRECRKLYRCTARINENTMCNRRHSKSIHCDKILGIANPGSGNASLVQNEATLTEGNDSDGSAASTNLKTSNVYLPIVSVKLSNGQTCYALLDNCSTNTFITEHLTRTLNLQSQPANFNIDTLGKITNFDRSVSLDICSADSSTTATLRNVLVAKCIPARHPSRRIKISDYEHLSGLHSVLSHTSHDVTVDILIGSDHASLLQPLEVKADPLNGNVPFATRSFLGWALSGPVPLPCNTGNANSGSLFNINLSNDIETQIESLWKVESEGTLDQPEMSIEDKKVIDLWENEIYMENSHYYLPIPWISGRPELPYNFYMAKHRLDALDKRNERDGLKQLYDQGIQDLLDRNFAERVPESEIDMVGNGDIYYLPHHGVKHPEKPGKLRIVMNAKSKCQGTSLNSQCLKGPDLLNKLLPVFLRFRQYAIGIMADIEKMYLCCRIPPKDRNTLRFLYRDSSGNLIHYRMCSHIFGGIWSSAAATFCLRRVIADFECSQMVKDVIFRSFFVDDMGRSVKEVTEGIEVLHGTKEVLKNCNFNLTKVLSNSQEINKSVQISDRAEAIKDLNLDGSFSKCLGIGWLIGSDKLNYRPRIDFSTNNPVTRRLVLSITSSMYDLPGLIAPIVVKGRMIFQILCKLKLPWDEEAPPSISSQWNLWFNSLKELENISFDRCLLPDDFIDGVSELVIFCDASSKAYGAVGYIRTVNRFGRIHVGIIRSQSRLVPIKGLTIPRAELCGAVVAVQLAASIRAHMDIEFVKSTYFTDSKIVRAYIQNTTRRFRTFVANRVDEIRRLSNPDDWYYIESSKNPADVLSRGCNGSELPDEWYVGPEFLGHFKCNWPDFDTKTELREDDPEILEFASCNVLFQEEESRADPLDLLANHYSSFYRLKKAVAYLLRVKDLLRRKRDQASMNELLTVQELTYAETVILLKVQAKAFPKEIHCLEKNKNIPRRSPILKLDPVLQSDLLVVGGKLGYSNLKLVKHPIILPKNDKVSELIVNDYHCMNHLGVEWNLSKIRAKFWVISARNMLKARARVCTWCKRLYGKPMEQKMSNLPMSRLSPYLPAFTFAGLDIFGNFYVKIGRSRAKRYGIVFTCSNTRACHIEVLNSLTSADFILALTRFFSRRGRPKHFLCDNATTFVGAYNELTKCEEEISKKVILQFTRQFGIEWNFNVPKASHHGGIWERMIRTIRRVIADIIPPKSCITDDQLSTFMCEAESIINGRPLIKSSDSIDDEHALTPNHFLLTTENLAIPFGQFTSDDSLRSKWKHVQHLTNCFWKRWIRQYLPLLQTRHKWQNVRDNVKQGDLVLMLDENCPRSQYPLALVKEVKQSRDGLTRSVRLRCKTKEYVRPITKIIFLEGSK